MPTARELVEDDVPERKPGQGSLDAAANLKDLDIHFAEVPRARFHKTREKKGPAWGSYDRWLAHPEAERRKFLGMPPQKDTLPKRRLGGA